jgi:SAM-dependent methyltransferase
LTGKDGADKLVCPICFTLLSNKIFQLTSACIICGNTEGNKIFSIKELQLGFNETFHYQLCKNCGSMQLTDPPADFSRYYPNEDYYSFKMEMKELKKPGYLQQVKSDHILYEKNKLLGSLLSIGYKIPEQYSWVKNTKVQPEDSILDVGCGNGSLLTQLFKMGFTNLTGIDPFLNEGHDYGAIKIYKKELHELNENFDLIMMHHSLEHMFDPLKALQKAFSLLNKNRYLLVRIPVMGNYGWQHYKTYWCGLDAPRHIFIPSEKGMKMLAAAAGFEIEKVEYDSNNYVIWCSEQYLKGIPLHASESWSVNRDKSLFTKEKIKEFQQKIMTENKKNNGDTAAYYLKKK